MKNLNTEFKKGLLSALDMIKNYLNNTRHASGYFGRHAHRGGLLFSKVQSFRFTFGAAIRYKKDNTPAMPLNDAHFGGFFASGGCR